MLIFVTRMPTRKNNKGKIRSYNMFICSYCKSIVYRRSDCKSESCGCNTANFRVEKRIKHGDCETRLYRCWQGIKSRCNNSNDTNYEHYGGRKIKMCFEWESDYSVFKEWAIQNGYSDDLEIDRIDNDKNYSPENCRWTTHLLNSQNRRNQKLTFEIAQQIRIDFINNKNIKKLSLEYNTCETNIRNILNNKRWPDSNYKIIYNSRPAKKSSYKEVCQIRKIFREIKITHKELGEQYNVTRSAISLILKNKNWKPENYDKS